MVLLPIVDRELRVAARRAGTYWMRFWAALIVLTTWFVVLNASRDVSQAEMGQHLLNALGVLTIGFCLLAGVFLTADCLSSEIREGTLGLLFLTDLKSYDVVLGKLVATSLHAFFSLLAVFPILGLCLLLGGVTGGEFWRLLLAYAATLFFSLGLGMAVSAVSRDTKQAIMRALFLIALLAGVLPALWWFQWSVWKNPSFDWLLLPSPAYTYLKAFDARYRFGGGPSEFWHSLLTILSLGFAGIVSANLVLPRLWQEKGAPPWLSSLRHLLSRKVVKTSPPRTSIGWENPVYWLTLRDPAPRLFARRLMWFILPIWFILAGVCIFIPKPIPAFIACFIVAYGLHQIVKVLVIAEASRRINLDRQSGALELLLATPLSIQTFVSGQKAALLRHFGPSLLILCGLNLGLSFLVLAFPRQLDIGGRDIPVFLELFLGGMVVLGFDFYALGWVGLWRGLNARQHHRAVGGTLLQVMAIPWLAIFFFIFLRQGFRSAGQAAFTFGCWYVAAIILDLFVARAAKIKLQASFRTIAAEK